MSALLVAAVLAAPAHHPPKDCTRTFTGPMIIRAIDATYRGTRDVSSREVTRLSHRYMRCARPRVNRVRMRSHLKAASAAWWTRRHPPPPVLYGPVTASWFYDGGATACGFHATYGFATLIGVPCGGARADAGPVGRHDRRGARGLGPVCRWPDV